MEETKRVYIDTNAIKGLLFTGNFRVLIQKRHVANGTGFCLSVSELQPLSQRQTCNSGRQPSACQISGSRRSALLIYEPVLKWK